MPLAHGANIGESSVLRILLSKSVMNSSGRYFAYLRGPDYLSCSDSHSLAQTIPASLVTSLGSTEEWNQQEFKIPKKPPHPTKSSFFDSSATSAENLRPVDAKMDEEAEQAGVKPCIVLGGGAEEFGRKISYLAWFRSHSRSCQSIEHLKT